jgi:hypothetical protein
MLASRIVGALVIIFKGPINIEILECSEDVIHDAKASEMSRTMSRLRDNTVNK